MTRKKLFLGPVVWSLVFCACGREDSLAAEWNHLFVPADSTQITDDQLASLARSTPGGRWRPQRVEGFDSGEQLIWLSIDGEEMAKAVMGIPTRVLEVPYWSGIFHLLGSPSRGGIFVATSLFYPIRFFGEGGVLVDSLTDPPPSWRQAREPVRGEFPPEKDAEFSAYLQSFTIITALAAVEDSVLVVAHGRFDGRGGRFRWNEPYQWSDVARTDDLGIITTGLDVYINGARVISDEPPPGEIFGTAPGKIFFLRHVPSGEEWTLVEYSWTGGH